MIDRKKLRGLLVAVIAVAGAPAVSAPGPTGREIVLKQIDLPHHYYYREMYLPQATTGHACAGAQRRQGHVLGDALENRCPVLIHRNIGHQDARHGV